jgi:hypothetical protein
MTQNHSFAEFARHELAKTLLPDDLIDEAVPFHQH